jgi:hypothetical protein
MAGLVRILTAVMFTAHILLGCCLHHAHAENVKNCPISDRDNPSAKSQCHDSHGNDSDHSQHGSRECQSSKCAAISMSRSAGNSFAQPAQTFVASPMTNPCPVIGVISKQCFLASGELLLPIRLHLANQVLLI